MFQQSHFILVSVPQSVLCWHSGQGLRRWSISLVNALSGGRKNPSIGAFWTPHEPEETIGEWTALPERWGKRAGLCVSWNPKVSSVFGDNKNAHIWLFWWNLSSTCYIHMEKMWWYTWCFSIYPTGGVPGLCTCDAPVWGLCQRSQQQDGEGLDSGTFPPKHCHNWLWGIWWGVRFDRPQKNIWLYLFLTCGIYRGLNKYRRAKIRSLYLCALISLSVEFLF